MSLLIQQAKSLAIQLHAEQTDKAWKPYNADGKTAGRYSLH